MFMKTGEIQLHAKKAVHLKKRLKIVLPKQLLARRRALGCHSGSCDHRAWNAATRAESASSLRKSMTVGHGQPARKGLQSRPTPQPHTATKHHPPFNTSGGSGFWCGVVSRWCLVKRVDLSDLVLCREEFIELRGGIQNLMVG